MLLSDDTPAPTVQRRHFAADAAIALLAERWPATFSVYERRRKPLAIGIRDKILAVLAGAITPSELGNALRHYCNNGAYLRAIRAGAPRIGLDGNPCGEVTAEQAAAAAVKLAGYVAARRRRRMTTTVPVPDTGAPAATAAPSSPLPALTLPLGSNSVQNAPEPAAPRRIGLEDLRRAAQERREREAAQ